MTGTSRTPFRQWTRVRATMLAVACLLAGIASGWAIRGLHRQTAVNSANSSPAPAPHNPAQLKAAADAQAAPLIDELKSNPADPQLLTELGNLYYDAEQYPTAIDFYRRALKAKPSDAAVRTDMATAYWYIGNTDSAIAEFNQALTYAPDNPNTLFNRGLVKWNGKKDAAGALADWNRLLATDPGYDQKEKVRQMIAEVEKHQAMPSALNSR